MDMFQRHIHTYMMEFFAKIVYGFCLLTIFAKSSIIDIWEGLKYVSAPFVEDLFLQKISQKLF